MTNHEAVTAFVDALAAEEPLTPYRAALAQSALTLARYLDDGAGSSTAVVAKEMRATLAELRGEVRDDDEDDHIFGADVAQVRHSSES